PINAKDKINTNEITMTGNVRQKVFAEYATVIFFRLEMKYALKRIIPDSPPKAISPLAIEFVTTNGTWCKCTALMKIQNAMLVKIEAIKIQITLNCRLLLS